MSLRVDDRDRDTACGECGTIAAGDSPFCGNCGARHRREGGEGSGTSGDTDTSRSSTVTAARDISRATSALVVAALVLVAIVAGAALQRPSEAISDEGRSPRGIGGTGLTSATAVAATEVAWRHAGGRPETHGGTGVENAELVDDVLLLRLDGVLRAYDVADGAERWRLDAWGETLQFHDGRLVLHTGNALLLVDTRTGAVVERFPAPASYWDSLPRLAGSVALIQTRTEIAGVDLEDGSQLWRKHSRDGNVWVVGTSDDTALLSEDGVTYTALDARTGEVLYRRPTETFAFSPSVISSGVAVFTDTGGNLTAFDLRTGEDLWGDLVGPVVGLAPHRFGDDAVAIGRLVNGTTRSAEYAIHDARTGEVRSRQPVPALNRNTLHPTAHGLVGGTAASLGLYVDGEAVWQIDVDVGPGSEPALPSVVGDSLVVLRDLNTVRVLDLASGATTWEFPAPPPRGFHAPTPLVLVGEDLVFASGSPAFEALALDRSTGLFAWDTTSGDVVVGTPDGVVLSLPDGGLALRSIDGAGAWTQRRGAALAHAVAVGDSFVAASWWSQGRTPSLDPLTITDVRNGEQVGRYDEAIDLDVAAAVPDRVYAVSLDRDELVALDLVDGEPSRAWSTPVSATAVFATPAEVVALSGDLVTVLDATTGAKRSTFDLGGIPLVAPVIVDGLLVSVDQRSTVVARSLAGEVAWERPLGAAPAGGATAAGDRLYIGTESGEIVVLAVGDGSLEATLSVGGALQHPPLVADGAIFAQLVDGAVVALR